MPRLILVAAPAGFGKTTLLSQWLTQWRDRPGCESRRVAWLSLDAGTATRRRFLTDLIAAIQIATPGVGVDAAALLRADAAPCFPVVIVQPDQRPRHPCGPPVLVLDDYHVIDAPTCTRR